MPEEYYLNKLYPFQDEILREIQGLDVDFYLSGGTALSRCFLDHRYSDDLDLFLNNHPNFKQQCEIVVAYLGKYYRRSKKERFMGRADCGQQNNKRVSNRTPDPNKMGNSTGSETGTRLFGLDF